MPEKILIIDDEPEICNMLSQRLKGVGYDAFHALDGEAGFNLAQETYPDLIILDLMMPKMSGEEVCKKIRGHENDLVSNIPIIMLTAKTQDIDEARGLVIGANAYIRKPFEWNELQKTIIRILPSIH